MSNQRIINQEIVDETVENIATIHAVAVPTVDYLAHTRMSLKFDEPVPEDVRGMLSDPSITADEIRPRFDALGIDAVVLRHFLNPGVTDSGEIEPHKTYAIELEPSKVHEYRDGFGKITRYITE